jgi:hypothetical protein
MSGFFFWGMIDDPVEKPSCSFAKPTSRVDQKMTSSARRERSIAVIVSTNVSSATTSRALVASIEFGLGAARPSSRATSAGSRPRVEPASAPAP